MYRSPSRFPLPWMRRCLVVSTVLLSCAIGETAAQRVKPVAIDRRPVSRIGRFVAKCDVGLVATVESVTTLKASCLVRLRVEETLFGERHVAGKPTVMALAGVPGYFGEPGNRLCVMLEQRAGAPFRARSRLLLGNAAGQRRLEVLRDLLRIDRQPLPPSLRGTEIRDRLFRVLGGGQLDLRLLALEELESVAQTSPAAFRPGDIERIEAACVGVRRRSVNAAIARLRRLLARSPDRTAIATACRRAVDGAATDELRRLAFLDGVRRLGREGVGFLIHHLRDKDADVRALSAYHLGELGEVLAAPALTMRLRVETATPVRESLIEALGRMGARGAVPVLEPLFERRELRRAIIVALARIDDERSRDALARFEADASRPAPDGDPEAMKTIAFIRSESFARQEARLDALRKKRSR